MRKLLIPIFVITIIAFSSYAYFMHSKNNQMPQNHNNKLVAQPKLANNETSKESAKPNIQTQTKVANMETTNKEVVYSNSKLIEIVAPSSAFFNKDKFAEAKKRINDAEFEYKIPQGIYDGTKNTYSANSEEYRLNHLKNSIFDNQVGIIWPVRGGYGAQDLIPHLMRLNQPEVAKMYIGYSDSTVLLLFLNQFWGWQVIHGPMIVDLVRGAQDPMNFMHLKKLMNREVDSIKYNNVIKPVNEVAKKHSGEDMVQMQEIKGIVTGGNLAIITATMGTDWEIETDGKILILEEVNERMYQVDRMLNQLRLAGKLDNIKALILSGMENPPNAASYQQELWDFTVKRLSQKLPNLPIYSTDSFGHSYSKYPFVIGSTASIIGYDLEFSDIKF